jgi:type II secretory ATPase GspE/PulE/Tfp pilus assembly ATPase PilB-like protein
MSLTARRAPRASLEDHVELSQFELHPPSIRLLPQQFCIKNQVIILDQVNATAGATEPILVAMLRKDDRNLIDQLRLHLKREIEPVQLSSFEIRKALSIAFGDENSASTKTNAPQTLQVKPTAKVSYDIKDAVELLNQILGHAITLGASDLHIESYAEDVDVRVRLDGILHQVNTPASPDLVRQISSRLKVLAGLDLTERTRALDGRVSISFLDPEKTRQIDARLSTLPSSRGEDLVLRFSTVDSGGLNIDQLGLDRREAILFKNLVRSPEGLLLYSGPTGSGKTSSMYACIRELSSAGLKIVTIEDPVEQVLPKVNQKEVNDKMDFADYARATLRQDPDAIMIGEIRDAETAEVALRAAYTGIMVFASLHASDAIRTFLRLKALVKDQDLVHNSVLGVLNQRLVRRLCPNCCKPKEISDKLRQTLGRVAENSTFYAAEGCDQCLGRGYSGRLGVFELVTMDDQLIELFSSQAHLSDIRAHLKQRGSRSLFEHAVERAASGETSLEEVFRVIPYRSLQIGR